MGLPKHTAGEGNGTPLQYSCLENPMDGGAWWASVHGVARSQTRLSDFTFTFHFHALFPSFIFSVSYICHRNGRVDAAALPSSCISADVTDLLTFVVRPGRVAFGFHSVWVFSLLCVLILPYLSSLLPLVYLFLSFSFFSSTCLKTACFRWVL